VSTLSHRTVSAVALMTSIGTFLQRRRQLRSTARLKMRCFAVWSVVPVTVILVVGAEAAGVSARDGRFVLGGDSIAEAVTYRTAPGHPTRADGREETLAALRFRWPVYGPITSDFGAPRPSRTRFHAGVDIGASRGTFVRAPARGTVAFVGWRSATAGRLSSITVIRSAPSMGISRSRTWYEDRRSRRVPGSAGSARPGTRLGRTCTMRFW